MAKAMNLGISNKGTCTTAAGTEAKTVQVADGFALAVGAMVLVVFQNAVTVASATLNVNSTGAKPIYYRGAALGTGLLKAGSSELLRYNGTQWEIIGNLNADSGFSFTEDDINGLDMLTAIGTATITEDDTNGLDVMTF